MHYIILNNKNFYHRRSLAFSLQSDVYMVSDTQIAAHNKKILKTSHLSIQSLSNQIFCKYITTTTVKSASTNLEFYYV